MQGLPLAFMVHLEEAQGTRSVSSGCIHLKVAALFLGTGAYALPLCRHSEEKRKKNKNLEILYQREALTGARITPGMRRGSEGPKRGGPSSTDGC
jgi:hypothetical protein